MRGLKNIPNSDLLIGSASSDDAAVYRLRDDLALVQTLDFFTPIVDDPYLFGQIAAANSLSDVYAMGGTPITAMNIVAVPTDEISLEDINLILKGGADKVAEAGAVLAGGHTVKNPEPLYGLSVTGTVHPDRVISNQGGKIGDRLILTKPLGTGIIGTAIKRGLASAELIAAATRCMITLNTPGTPVAAAGLTRAGTDVTGFGLLGHLSHLCRESKVSARLDSATIPIIDDPVLDLIREDCIPGGSRKNLELAEKFTRFDEKVSPELRTLLADAQTSGGLLLAIAPNNLEKATRILHENGALCVIEIGELIAQEDDFIIVN